MTRHRAHSLPLAVVDELGRVFEGWFDCVPDAMVATDVEGTIVRVNRSGDHLFGYPPDSLHGVSMERLVPERYRKEYREHRKTVLEGNTAPIPELEVYVLAAGGHEIPIDAAVGPIETAGTTHIVMVMREVSDRVANQEYLERRLALEALVVSISRRLNTPTLEEIDEQVQLSLAELGEFAGADRSYIFEYSDETTMRNTYEWCSPGIESRIDQLQAISLETLPWMGALIAEGRVVHISSVDDLPPEAAAEQNLLRRLGVLSMVNVPMFSGGRVVGLIGFDSVGSSAIEWPADEISTYKILQDSFATALHRKQVGIELRRANRMLRAVSECNDAVVRAGNEDTLLRDVCRIVVETGGYAMAWAGFACDDEDKSIQPVARWGRDDGYVDELRLTWADTERGMGPAGTAVRTHGPVAVQDIAADSGFVVWREAALERGFASTISVPLHNGDIAGVLAVYADELAAFDRPEVETLQRFADDLAYGIGALRTRERQKQAEEQLREMLRSKDQLIATIAHELRTPLTGIVGFAQVLLDEGSSLSADDRADMIRMVVEEGVDLTNIVDDLLAAAKAEAGTLTVAHVPVDLRAQAAQVLESWDQGATDHIEFTGPTVNGIADPARVRQILRNLISNALRYGSEPISVSVRGDDSAALVRITDRGPGVSKEDREAIFAPYQRAHDAPGVTASVGIGLTISRHLARLMGGDLTYEREAGESAFTLSLPLVTGSHTQVSGAAE